MSEQDSKRATLGVKKRTVVTSSGRDEKPRLRAGARGRQVAQLKLAKDKTKRSAPPTPEVSTPRAEHFGLVGSPTCKLVFPSCDANSGACGTSARAT